MNLLICSKILVTIYWSYIRLYVGPGPHSPDAPRLFKAGPLCPITKSWEPCNLTKVPNGPTLKLLMSSSSKKKEPRYACLSEVIASHSQKCEPRSPLLLHTFCTQDCPAALIGGDVSSACCVLDWVLFKDKNFALAARLGPEINSGACLWVPSRPRHLAQCWLINQRLSLLCILRLETPRAGSGVRNPRAEPLLASSSAISFHLIYWSNHNWAVWNKYCCYYCGSGACVLFNRSHIWQRYILHQASVAVAVTVFYRYVS